VRIFHRYHHSRVRDFSQTGLAALEANRLFLGHIDRDFSAHVIGVSVQVRL